MSATSPSPAAPTSGALANSSKLADSHTQDTTTSAGLASETVLEVAFHVVPPALNQEHQMAPSVDHSHGVYLEKDLPPAPSTKSDVEEASFTNALDENEKESIAQSTTKILSQAQEATASIDGIHEADLEAASHLAPPLPAINSCTREPNRQFYSSLSQHLQRALTCPESEMLPTNNDCITNANSEPKVRDRTALQTWSHRVVIMVLVLLIIYVILTIPQWISHWGRDHLTAEEA